MDKATLARLFNNPAAFQAALRIPAGGQTRRFGDCMADFQKAWFEAVNPSLLAVATGRNPVPSRFWVERCKGTSKTSDMGVCLLWLLVSSRRPLFMQVGAADRDQANEVHSAAVDIIRANVWLGHLLDVQKNRLTCSANDAELQIISSDALTGHGARPDVLLLDELVHHKSEDFAATCMDNSSKVVSNLTIISTNSGFQNSWQWRWRELARQSDRWHFQSVREPAPWIDKAVIEEARLRNSSTRFNRLWRGAWPTGSGDALDSDDILAAIDKDMGPLARSLPGMVFVAGLDLGIRRDHSALVVLGIDPETQRYRLASCESWAPVSGGDVDWERVEQAVRTAHRRFDLRCVAFDPYQAALMAQRLRRRHIPMREVTFVGKNLDAMATAILDVFRSRRIDLFDAPELVQDLSRLSIVERGYGHKLEAISDASGHADRATALALALLVAKDVPLSHGEWGGLLETPGWATSTSRVSLAFGPSSDKAYGEAPSRLNLGVGPQPD